jgi:NAD(P)-dependent dehydrogenase (short-subunit alcohol dehydrogenase family)
MPTILMTGGHAGLGLVAAQTLAGRFGCDLILTGRNPERVEAAARRLRETIGIKVSVVELDLNSLASVRAGVAQCKALLQSAGTDNGGLGGIVCNAGAPFHKSVSYSADGYEETFAGNCLGHFLLVNLMLDCVAHDGRIVWTSSGTHDPASMDGRSVGSAVEPDARALVRQGRDGKPISGGRRYATSKLCVILYAYELERRLRRTGSQMASIAYDPGFLPDTGMGRGAPAIFRSSAAKYLLRKMGMTMGQMPFSGEALSLLAADPAFAGVTGAYINAKDGKLNKTRSSPASYDEATAAKLWRDSEELIRLAS